MRFNPFYAPLGRLVPVKIFFTSSRIFPSSCYRDGLIGERDGAADGKAC